MKILGEPGNLNKKISTSACFYWEFWSRNSTFSPTGTAESDWNEAFAERLQWFVGRLIVLSKFLFSISVFLEVDLKAEVRNMAEMLWFIHLIIIQLQPIYHCNHYHKSSMSNFSSGVTRCLYLWASSTDMGSSIVEVFSLSISSLFSSLSLSSSLTEFSPILMPVASH